MTVGQPPTQSVKLNLNNLLEMLFGQRMEHDGFIHAIQELGTEVMPEFIQHRFLHYFVTFTSEFSLIFQNPVTAEIGSHYHYRVLEIDGPPLSVRKSSVIKNLQKHIEYVGVGLLNFVEKDYTIWTT